MAQNTELTMSVWKAALDELTPTEKYPQGRTARSIAEELGISPNTVQTRLKTAVKAGTWNKAQDYRRGRLYWVYWPVTAPKRSTQATRKA